MQIAVNHRDSQWGKKNPIIPPLWLKAVWMIGDVESACLVWGLLAPCLTQPLPFCALPPQLPAVCSHAHLQSACVVFMWSIFSIPATGFCTSVCLVSSSFWEEELKTDTCWVEQSCSITGLMHHGGPQRTPRTYSGLCGIRLCCFD